MILAAAVAVVALLAGGIGYGFWQEHQRKELYAPIDQSQAGETATAAEVADKDIPQGESLPEVAIPVDEDGTVLESLQQEIASEESAQEPPEVPVESAPVPTQTAEELEAERITAETIEQLHQVQSDYQAQLDGVVETTIAEFLALPPEEQTQENKMALVDAKYDQISAMELACDAQVEALVQVIAKAQLTLGNYDLVNEIRSYYAECKATWKADCLTALATS